MCFLETGFCHVGRAGLELLTSCDPPTSASQSTGIIGEPPHPAYLFLCLGGFVFVFFFHENYWWATEHNHTQSLYSVSFHKHKFMVICFESFKFGFNVNFYVHMMLSCVGYQSSRLTTDIMFICTYL